jgi:hypothetical protein
VKCGFIVRKVPNVIREPQADDHIWNWNGDFDRPTTNPDISMKASMPGEKDWNGYLLNGQFVAV